MLLAAYLAGAFCVAATGAWYVLRNSFLAEARVMLRMGLSLASILIPVQLVFGHLVGDYVHNHQPAKFAAIEARWHDEQPASEVIIAIPDDATETNLYELKIPVLGSIIGSMSLTSKEVGLTSFPPQDRPPVLIPFLTFRIMVGCGLVMLALAWLGSWLIHKHRLEAHRWLLGCIFVSFPLPFIATLAGWYTAEVGRQPWVVYGVLRTAKAMTPFLTAHAALTTLILFGAVYAFIFSFGTYYIHRLLRAGPVGPLATVPSRAMPNRPMSLVDPDPVSRRAYLEAGE
jgi:cytochrome bd ubiquinol oxidase subunit I